MTRNDKLRGLHILAVDDDEDTLEMLRFILQQQGANVVTADSVTKAVDTLRQFVPDVILTDIGMPDYNGYALIKLVRAKDEKEGRNTPTIALTAYTSTADKQTALSSGFQKYLSKPFDPAELIETIGGLVRHRQAAPEGGVR
jgi:DNA-binding response OmpR family regulator